MFMDTDHITPVVFLLDTSKRAAVISELRSRGVGTGLNWNWNGAEARQGRWDFAQLGDWYGYLTARVFAIDGVFSADIKESNNRLEYGVIDTAAKSAVETLLAALDVPCYLVAFDS
jgi:hypothetical protein